MMVPRSTRLARAGLALALALGVAAASAAPVEPPATAKASPRAKAPAAKPPPVAAPEPVPAPSVDRAELDRTQIIGNRELPKVLYIVPWKKPMPGDLTGRPPGSVLDEALAPVDREVFRRQVRYDAQAQARIAPPATPATK